MLSKSERPIARWPYFIAVTLLHIGRLYIIDIGISRCRHVHVYA